jgi:hypothetical protein
LRLKLSDNGGIGYGYNVISSLRPGNLFHGHPECLRHLLVGIRALRRILGVVVEAHGHCNASAICRSRTLARSMRPLEEVTKIGSVALIVIDTSAAFLRFVAT